MQTQTITSENTTDKKLFIKMVTDAWETYNKRFNKLLDTLPAEQLAEQTAPGRNSGTYLAGHLVAISDAMLPLLGFGEKLYPELESIFVSNPDRAGLTMPSIDEIKKYRDAVNAKLAENMAALQPEEWFARHSAVPVEAFANEPHRNKLNLLMNRTNHMSYHLGQLAYLVKKAPSA